MNVGELREIINDQEIPDSTPVRVRTSYRISTWEWQLDGATAKLAGEDHHIILELGVPGLYEQTLD